MALVDAILALNPWAKPDDDDAGARLAATRARYGAGLSAWSDWAAAMTALRDRLPLVLLRRGEARALWERCAAVDLAGLRDADGDVVAELFAFPGDVILTGGAPFRSVALSGARIDGALRAGGAQVSSRFALDQARVAGAVDARGAQILGDSSFEATRFEGPWSAEDARFVGLAWFRAAAFGAAASFATARFEGELGFHTVAAAGRVSFRDASFADTASFQRSRFRRGCDFTGARFSAARHVDGAEGDLIGLKADGAERSRRA